MPELIFPDIITERDIDRLLMEELACNATFREWFLVSSRMRNAAKGKFLTIGHSVTDNELGESDLVLCVEMNGGIHAVLIENKIDAPLQPGQGTRYRKRGERGLKQGLWNQYTTCLVAPDRYLKSTDPAMFGTFISYEAIARWFGRQPSKHPRMAYRSQVVEKAIAIKAFA